MKNNSGLILSVYAALALLVCGHAVAQNQPLISPVPNQSIRHGISLMPVRFAVTSAAVPAPELRVTGYSSDQSILADTNIIIDPVIGRNLTDRVVWLRRDVPAEKVDFAIVTLVVTDGTASSQQSFTATWYPFWSDGRALENRTPIIIPAQGAANPFPSAIDCTDVPGLLSNVRVTLSGLTHSFPADLGLLLVSPSGGKVVLMRNAGFSAAASGLTLAFQDEASQSVPLQNLSSGIWRPADYGANRPAFLAPAPAGPYSTELRQLCGTPVMGRWALYAQDDTAGDGGAITNGWSLELEAAPTLFSLHDTNAYAGETVVERFFVGNTALQEAHFMKFSSHTAAVPLNNIQVVPADTTGTNYVLRFTPAQPATNVVLGLFTTNSTGAVLAERLTVNVFSKPLLQCTANGQKLFVYLNGIPGTVFSIEKSPDASTWTKVGEVMVLSNGSARFETDLSASSSTSLYRAVLAPR